MSKPSNRSPERKLQVVLSVPRGEVSATEATRRVGVAKQPVHNWKRMSLDASRDGLAQGHRRRSSRELELEAENEELRAALGEAHVHGSPTITSTGHSAVQYYSAVAVAGTTYATRRGGMGFEAVRRSQS